MREREATEAAAHEAERETAERWALEAAMHEDDENDHHREKKAKTQAQSDDGWQTPAATGQRRHTVTTNRAESIAYHSPVGIMGSTTPRRQAVASPVNSTSPAEAPRNH